MGGMGASDNQKFWQSVPKQFTQKNPALAGCWGLGAWGLCHLFHLVTR